MFQHGSVDIFQVIKLHLCAGVGDASECLHTHTKHTCVSRHAWTCCTGDDPVTGTHTACCVIYMQTHHDPCCWVLGQSTPKKMNFDSKYKDIIS